MATNEGGGGNGAPRRPTISLPPRGSMENLFRAGGGGGAADASPGPMTLVTSFFAEDPGTESVRSFSELLAGAISSPAAAQAQHRRELRPPAEEGRGQGATAAPAAAQASPFFMFSPGLSPGGLFDSPTFFSSGPFGISHQQALAQVTAQAAQSQFQVHVQAEHRTLSAATTASSAQPKAPTQEMLAMTSDANNATFESAEGLDSDQKPQPTVVVDKPADDGYNWRKYGQKQVKGSEFPRSYYKCTHSSCPVKKKVERSLDGQVTEIIYRGQHNHEPPQANKRAKEGGTLSSGVNREFPANSETGSQSFLGRSNEAFPASGTKRDRESNQGTPEQLSDSSDGEEVPEAEHRMDEGEESEHEQKRRNVDTKVSESNPSHRTVTEPRIIVQTTSEVDLLDDGYRWRKYGQKVVKGNPNPRSYYKCTHPGCNVRKHVERASTDPKAVITTYEGKHNHEVPAARNSSHNTANAAAIANIQPKGPTATSRSQGFLNKTATRNSGQMQVAVLQLKEDEIT